MKLQQGDNRGHKKETVTQSPPHKIIYTLSAKDRRGTFEKYTGNSHTRGG